MVVFSFWEDENMLIVKVFDTSHEFKYDDRFNEKVMLERGEERDLDWGVQNCLSLSFRRRDR
jgi:hypothetical protein